MKVKYPFVKQSGIKDCGPACLLMILKYYHGDMNIEKIKLMCNTTNEGTSAYDLINTANKLGFKGVGYKLDIDTLFNNKVKLPCIAHTIIDNIYHHYVVIYEIKEKEIIIADPNKRIIKMTKEKFNKIFNNIVIELKPIKKITKQNNYQELKKIISKLFYENRKYFLKTLFFSVISIIISILTLIITKIQIDNYFNKNILLNLLLIYIAITIVKIILNHKLNKIKINIDNNIDFFLTTNVYETLIYLPYKYYSSHSTGENIKKINDQKIIKDTIIFLVNSVLVYIPLCLISLFILLYINKKLTIVVLISLFLNIIIIIKNKNKKIMEIEKSIILNEDINNNIFITIDNINTINGLSIEEKIINKFKEKYMSYQKYISKVIYKLSKEKEFLNLVNTITNGIIIYIGCLEINNYFELSSLMIFLSIKEIIFIPITNIQDNNIQLKNAFTLLNRTNDLYMIKRKKVEKTKKQIRNIYIKKIFYKYKNKTIDIKCNLVIKKGEKILLVGSSGIGKTTLLNQLFKNIKTKNNSIFLDDIDINNINSSVIKNNIIYQNSKDMIYTDTINNNYLSDDIKKINEIEQICCMNKDKSIDLYANNLSDGEKQKITLARLLIENKNIYLLDETFNKIDINTERKILKSIFKKYKSKTFIIVSHRLDNIDLFDKIVELKENNIDILQRKGAKK